MNNPKLIQDYNAMLISVIAPLSEQIKSNGKYIEALNHIFRDKVSDFRNQLKIVYKLENILCICLLLALRGKFTSFYNAALYIQVRRDYFRSLGLIEGDKTPSHDTFRRIFMNLDAEALRDALLKRMDELMRKIAQKTPGYEDKIKLISGDGKTFNGSGRKNGKRNINVFNILDASSSLCLMSEPLDDKESEIKAFQKAIEKLKLSNTMVTADALHCQRETLSIISQKKGLYTITVKDNQPALKQHIEEILDKNQSKCIFQTYNKCDYQIFILDYPTTEEDFPLSKAFVRMISHKRKNQPNYSPTTRIFISSSNNPQLIMEAIDNRWYIESDYHWFKDVFLKEDECTFMHKNSIKVMATLNNIAYAFYKIASAIFGDGSMAVTRIKFEECPEQMLALLIPLLDNKNLATLLRANMRGAKKTVDAKPAAV